MESSYQYLVPDYDQVALTATADTLHFPLHSDFYNKVKSFNTFTTGGKQYISFYNQQARAICIYSVENQEFVKNIHLKESIIGKRVDNVSVYAHSFDSILVTTKPQLYLIDSTGRVKSKFELLPDQVAKERQAKKNGLTTQISLGSTKPAIFRNGALYSAVRPAYQNSRSLSAQKRMHLIYSIDLSGQEASLLYNFPKAYWENYFGYYFLEFHYCINQQGDFIVSFAGDPNIFVTNLTDTSRAFPGKSRSLTKGIMPLGREVDSVRVETDHYDTNDKYGPIYADLYHKRYLRVARKSKYKDNLKTIKNDSLQFLIVFDENYKIIGESYVPKDIILRQLFITLTGEIYARVKNDDEYVIHFVRLEYIEKTPQKKLAGR